MRQHQFVEAMPDEHALDGQHPQELARCNHCFGGASPTAAQPGFAALDRVGEFEHLATVALELIASRHDQELVTQILGGIGFEARAVSARRRTRRARAPADVVGGHVTE
jgi:hypothetical protein